MQLFKRLAVLFGVAGCGGSQQPVSPLSGEWKTTVRGEQISCAGSLYLKVHDDIVSGDFNICQYAGSVIGHVQSDGYHMSLSLVVQATELMHVHGLFEQTSISAAASATWFGTADFEGDR